MADRYQNRPFPADTHNRGDDPHAAARAESDPLAELARLIGQTDPFGGMSRTNQQVQPRGSARDQREKYEPPAETYDDPPASPPPWMQRANRQETPPREDHQRTAEHPLRRYATPLAAPEPNYDQPLPLDAAAQEADPSRYDDALYGQFDADAQEQEQDLAYAHDSYGYQDGYGDHVDEPAKHRGGMVTVAVVLALAVLGTGAAFAYRTFVGSPRSGEPPIIKADNSPTKIVPAPTDGTAKLPDRLSAGDGTEKIVPREEAPVDVNAQSGPRVVFPPLNQNGNPPSAASVAPSRSALANAANGTLPNSEPRKIRTFSVHGDQPDAAATPTTATSAPTAKPPAASKSAAAPRNANASANGPLSLAPQGDQPTPVAEPHTRVAATNPAQSAASGGGTGGYLVQVSSQRNEADAQASYRALQGKFPTVLGSRPPVIKRADLGEKGVYYRAMVGPFGSPEEASQFCGSLKTAGGQCVVQRN
jgi:SPOR domain